jgi:glycosyltransferase involved in cell wall biosynthesis
MNILVLNYEYPPVGGGGATVTAQLCGRLASLGHGVDVITMHYGRLPREETEGGVRIIRTPALRRRPDLCRIPEMATYLLGALGPALEQTRRRTYDVIHAHFIIPTSPLARVLRRKTGIPYVLTCHGSDVPGYNPDRFQLIHKLLMPAWRRLTRSADLLVSPSGSLKRLIEQQCPEAQVRVIPNGFDLSLFEAGRPRTKSILLCSRLLPRKGFQYFLQAVQDLDLDWQIHIVGDGPYLEPLRKLAAACKPSVEFHGWLERDDPKLRMLYETSSIFVFPSEAENFPTVLLEAMAAGSAILTSTAGGCPEVVGETALLAEPKNPQAIREQLLRLIESEPLRRSLSEAARRRAQQFTWPAVAARYLEAYAEAVERRRAQ